MEVYRKGIDSAVDADYETALSVGKIRVGRTYLFYRPILKVEYIPLQDIAQAWRRVEEANSKVGCCSAGFDLQYLMLQTKQGETLKLKIGEAFYRHEPEQLMEKLKENAPQVKFEVLK